MSIAKPIAAAVLLLIGGAIVILSGLLFLMPGISTSIWWEIFIINMFFIISLITGTMMLISGAAAYIKPEKAKTWGIIGIIFAIISLGGTGGLLIGFILGLIGSILALTYKEKTKKGKSIVKYGYYGWKYVIVVVIGVAIIIAIFLYATSGPGPDYTCAAISGYECISPVLSHTTGLLSVTLGQSTGSTQFNASFICATKGNNGLPYVKNGSPNVTRVGNVESGGAVNVNLQCYDSSGNLIPKSTPLDKHYNYNIYIWETYYNKNGSNSTTSVIGRIPGLTAS